MVKGIRMSKKALAHCDLNAHIFIFQCIPARVTVATPSVDMAEDQNFASDYHKHERVLIPNSSDIIGEEASGSAKEITDSDAISFSSESLPSSMDLSDSSQGFTQPRKVGRQTPSVLQTNSEPGSLPTSPTQNDSDIGIILDQLPSEIILHICSFIDARFVVCTLSRVCQFFHHLLNDRIFWKVRIRKRWPKKYPAIPGKFSFIYWSFETIANDTIIINWLIDMKRQWKLGWISLGSQFNTDLGPLPFDIII